MAKGNLTLRMDSELKAQASELFKVKKDEPNEATYKAMEYAKNNEDIYGPFDSVKDLISNLF